MPALPAILLRSNKSLLIVLAMSWLLSTHDSFIFAQAPATALQSQRVIELSPGDLLRVIKAGAEVHKRDKSVMNVAVGTRVEVSKVRGDWIGGFVQVGEQPVPGWILKADLALAPDPKEIEVSVEALTQLGVTIEKDAAGLPHTAAGEDASLTDEDLNLFLPLVDLQEIDLSGTEITGSGLTHMSGLVGLQRLYLDGAGLTDVGLAAIGKLNGLTGLSVSETEITDAGLAHLKNLKKLKVLNLGDTGITDKGLLEIAGLKGIETLTLSRTRITGTGFEQMQDFQDLITLNLDGCQLKAGTLQNFKDLKKIRIMRMYDATAPEEDIEVLEEEVGGLAIFR